MIQQLLIYLVSCDEPELRIGPGEPISWSELMYIVNGHCDLLWEMHGERRILLLHTLKNLWRVAEAQRELVRLGRSTEIELHPFKFIWDQTVPLSQLLPNSPNNDWAVPDDNATNDANYGSSSNHHPS